MANKEAKLQIIVDAQNRAGSAFGTLGRDLDAVSRKTADMRAGMMAIGTAGTVAFGALAVGVGSSIRQSSDLAESINAVNVVFKDAADQILAYSDTTARAIGLAKSDFNSLATVSGALLKATGLPLDQVAERTINLSQRASDLASVFNTTVPDAMAAMNAALRGETEPIRRYAGDVTDATLETYLLSQGINQAVTELSQAEKIMYRYDLLMQQTSDTAGDFANTSGELANRSRILGAELKNLQATIGDEFRPILVSVLSAVQPVVQALADWTQAHPELTKWIIIAVGATTLLMAALLPIAMALPGLIVMFGYLTGAMAGPALIAAAVIAAIVGINIALHQLNQANLNTAAGWQDVWLGIKIIAAEQANAVIGIVESMINFVLSGVNKAIEAINKVIRLANKVPGINLKSIRSIDAVELGGVDVGSIYSKDLAGRSVAPQQNTVLMQGNTFLSADIAEQIGDMIMGKLKLSTQL